MRKGMALVSSRPANQRRSLWSFSKTAYFLIVSIGVRLFFLSMADRNPEPRLSEA